MQDNVSDVIRKRALMEAAAILEDALLQLDEADVQERDLLERKIARLRAEAEEATG